MKGKLRDAGAVRTCLDLNKRTYLDQKMSDGNWWRTPPISTWSETPCLLDRGYAVCPVRSGITSAPTFNLSK